LQLISSDGIADGTIEAILFKGRGLPSSFVPPFPDTGFFGFSHRFGQHNVIPACFPDKNIRGQA